MPGVKSVDVVIAEDKEVLRLGLRQIINAIPGCNVVSETLDGPTTVNEALKLQPNLILMRDNLPSLDGTKTAQQIKKDLPKTRIIMLLTNSSDFFRATQSGADGYIMRETPEHLIASAIETVTTGGAWIGPLVSEYLLHGDGLSQLRRCNKERIELPGLSKLTRRERDVLRLVVKGLSNQKIANFLGLRVETIKVHMRSILKKLHVEGRAEAISKTLRAGQTI